MELIEKLVCTINLINENNKKPRAYGTGHLLYQSEIHTIEVINNHKAVNASELAVILGVTNGAVTQIISRLVQKGLVERYKLRDNKKEVYFQLTGKGLVAYDCHMKFHERMNNKVIGYLDQLNKDEVLIISQFFDKIIENMPYDE